MNLGLAGIEWKKSNKILDKLRGGCMIVLKMKYNIY